MFTRNRVMKAFSLIFTRIRVMKAYTLFPMCCLEIWMQLCEPRFLLITDYLRGLASQKPY